MKFLLSTGLAAIMLCGVGIQNILAQTNVEPERAESNNPALTLPLLQAVPLVQATSKLLGQQSYEIESEVEIKLDLPSAPVSNAQIKTAIAAPNKVNAEITFGRNKSTAKKYQIISDGVQVWIFDELQNQYSVSEYQQFIESETGLAIGTLANFYLKTLNGVNNNPVASRAITKLPPDRLLKYFQRFANIDLQNMVIRNEEIEGEAYVLYDINAADQSYRATAYVTPQLAEIERVDISGKKDGLDLLVTEKIISQTVPESIGEDEFNFVPPPDAQQIESQIEINPF